MAQPGDADPGAKGRCAHARPERRDAADDLVARDDRQPAARKLAVHHVQIGAADGAGLDVDADWPGPGEGGARSSQTRGVPVRRRTIAPAGVTVFLPSVRAAILPPLAARANA